MQQTGLITGASSGIGKALAHEHARRGRDLVVVARRAAELESLAAELRERYGTQVRVYPADLTAPGARRQLYDELMREGITVEYLLNNAGFGARGNFHEQDFATLDGMIELNIAAVTELTHLFLPGMVARRRGRILNVSSTAGFMPGPLQAVYFATKAYVNSFTQGVATEVADSGVTLTALCPGAVRTEFAETAGMADSKLFERAKSPEYTARRGYAAMEAGKREVITEPQLLLAIKGLLPFVPSRLVSKLVKKLQQ